MKLLKETSKENEASARSHGRWYGDACGTAFGLEILGERWAMLIVRELLLGPRRFSDLREVLPGISAKVLTERLENLAGWGVLTRSKLPPPASVQVYELTEWGYAAEVPIMELGRWAARSLHHNPHLPLSSVSLMTSMKTMQLPVLAEAPDMRIGMQVGEEEFVVTITDGLFNAERARIENCAAVLRSPGAPPIAGALYADIPLDALESEAGLVVEGDRKLVERFVRLFGLPPKIDA